MLALAARMPAAAVRRPWQCQVDRQTGASAFGQPRTAAGRGADAGAGSVVRLDAQLVALRVSKDDPGSVTGLANIGVRGAQCDEPLRLGGWLTPAQVHMQPVFTPPRVPGPPEHQGWYPLARILGCLFAQSLRSSRAAHRRRGEGAVSLGRQQLRTDIAAKLSRARAPR